MNSSRRCVCVRHPMCELVSGPEPIANMDIEVLEAAADRKVVECADPVDMALDGTTHVFPIESAE